MCRVFYGCILLGGLCLTYAVIYGIGFSCAFTMIQLMIAELFAGPTYGRILGVYVFIDKLVGAMGIAALAQLRVMSDNYYPVINMMIGLCVAAFVCVYVSQRTTVQVRAADATT
ncbi:MAG: hypothetical protein P8L79_01585 [Rhodospirillaceae bacterium]|nr:hypothetical protein [Rhodospirillaceae bacterium]